MEFAYFFGQMFGDVVELDLNAAVQHQTLVDDELERLDGFHVAKIVRKIERPLFQYQYEPKDALVNAAAADFLVVFQNVVDAFVKYGHEQFV